MLYSAPVILASGQTKVKKLVNHIFVEKNSEKLGAFQEELRDLVTSNQSVKEMEELCSFYANKALESLDLFPDSEAKQALVNITKSSAV